MGLSTALGKRLGGQAAERAFEALAERLAVGTRTAIDAVVRHRGTAIAAEADVFRLSHPELAGAALDRALIRDRARRAGAGGLVSGLPSVVLGIGSATEVVAAIADAANVTYAQVSLVLALAHLHGRDVRSVEARRLDVLIVLGLEAGVVRRDGEHLTALDRRLDLDAIGSEGLPDDVVGQLNRELGERVVKRIAKRRARSVAGRLMPLGLGVAAAGFDDLRWLQSVGKAARTYFGLLDSSHVAVASARS